MKGIEIKGENFKAYLSFVNEPFKSHGNITDVYERIEAHSNNLTVTEINIVIKKGVIIDGVTGINNFLDALADSQREVLKGINILLIKNEIAGITNQIQKLKIGINELKNGLTKNDLLKKDGLIPLEYLKVTEIVYKAKIKNIEFIISEVNKLIDKPETSKPANDNQSKPIDKSESQKLTAPIIKRFCELCNNSGLDKKDVDENVIPYCKRICLKFDLKYTDNVRQHFDFDNKPKPNDKHLKKVIELILPKLKASDRAIIDNYIKSK